MPFGFHPLYLLVLLVIVLIVFGPGKLPEVGSALGRGIREFNKAKDELTMQMQQTWSEPPAETSTPVTAEAPVEAAASEPEVPATESVAASPDEPKTES
jgi:sec-independent protein translocase protein TatA